MDYESKAIEMAKRYPISVDALYYWLKVTDDEEMVRVACDIYLATHDWRIDDLYRMKERGEFRTKAVAI